MATDSKALRLFQPFLDPIKKALSQAGVTLRPFQLRESSYRKGTLVTFHNYRNLKRNGKELRLACLDSQNVGALLPLDARRVAQNDCFDVGFDYIKGGLFKKPEPLGLNIYYYMRFKPDKSIDAWRIKKEDLHTLETALESLGFRLTYTMGRDPWNDYSQDYLESLARDDKEIVYLFFRYIPIKAGEFNPKGVSFEEALRIVKDQICPNLLQYLKGYSNTLGNGVINGIKAGKLK